MKYDRDVVISWKVHGAKNNEVREPPPRREAASQNRQIIKSYFVAETSHEIRSGEMRATCSDA